LLVMVGIASSIPTVMTTAAHASTRRRTPIVEAVEKARPAIVNIHGQKTIDAGSDSVERTKRVNGMGTGVMIDERGYIITNHHVIEGVRQIQVTLSNQRTYVARLIARDPLTDLAIVKINAPRPLPLITIGTSSDLMPGESVIAVGNAYGYHHTVTRGIISALNREVEVTDAQKYFDLIQTDAAINPGNSGGPLLNIDGEMIGINVAVRVGAQGIGFAIPVDKAVEVAERLLNAERVGGTMHGVEGTVNLHNGVQRFTVTTVRRGSPAERAGLKSGDIINAVGKTKVRRQLDVERALLGLKPGANVLLSVRRNSGSHQLDLQLARSDRNATTDNAVAGDVWQNMGVRVTPVSATVLHDVDSKYNGGLKVTALRNGSLADRNGIRPGDIIVGMHVWETVTMDNLDYVLNRADLDDEDSIRFYVVRGSVTRVGQLPLRRR
jgi:serine protease Do